MDKASLNRRGFLRLCIVAAGGAVVTACQPSTGNPTSFASDTTVATGTPVPPEKINLVGEDQDVWAWTKPVKVEASQTGNAPVIVYVNGKEFEAAPAGDLFQAEVRLSEGINRISAARRSTNGGEIRSNMLNYTESLRQVPNAVTQIALDGDRIVLDGGKSLPVEGSHILDHIWSPRPGNPASLSTEEGKPFVDEISAQTLMLQSPQVDGEYYVDLRVKDESGREDRAVIYFVVEQGKPRIPDYDTENPDWVEKAIVYGIIPNKFGHPAFQAITHRLMILSIWALTPCGWHRSTFRRRVIMAMPWSIISI
jgi:cyclomaltodextrinase / maltogenic alpha-amylase / neopullulanase